MKLDTNTNAYKLFLQIEIACREHLASCIYKEGIQNWAAEFIGHKSRDSIKEIAKKIRESEENKELADIRDIYLLKIKKSFGETFKIHDQKKIFHPFYFLTWSELTSLYERNKTVVQKHMSKEMFTLLVENLKFLNRIRNDVAHARLISHLEFEYLRQAFGQISGIIPNFQFLADNPTEEENFVKMGENLNQKTSRLFESGLQDIDELKQCIALVENLKTSFWLNSLITCIIPAFEKARVALDEYIVYRQKPGGLLEIQTWKNQYKELFEQLNFSKNAIEI